MALVNEKRKDASEIWDDDFEFQSSAAASVRSGHDESGSWDEDEGERQRGVDVDVDVDVDADTGGSASWGSESSWSVERVVADPRLPSSPSFFSRISPVKKWRAKDASRRSPKRVFSTPALVNSPPTPALTFSATPVPSPPIFTPHRRSSLGDLNRPTLTPGLKIPAHISRAQDDIRRDMDDVRDFAVCVEQLRTLQHTYTILLHQLHTAASPLSSPTKHKHKSRLSPTKLALKRKFSFTSPAPSSDPLAKYAIWWERAEVIIILASTAGTEDTGRGAVAAGRQRAVTLSSGSAGSTHSPKQNQKEKGKESPSPDSPPPSHWRATTGRFRAAGAGDVLTPRQMLLLRGMLAGDVPGDKSVRVRRGNDSPSVDAVKGKESTKEKVRVLGGGRGLGIKDLWRGLGVGTKRVGDRGGGGGGGGGWRNSAESTSSHSASSHSHGNDMELSSPTPSSSSQSHSPSKLTHTITSRTVSSRPSTVSASSSPPYTARSKRTITSRISCPSTAKSITSASAPSTQTVTSLSTATASTLRKGPTRRPSLAGLFGMGGRTTSANANNINETTYSGTVSASDAAEREEGRKGSTSGSSDWDRDFESPTKGMTGSAKDFDAGNILEPMNGNGTVRMRARGDSVLPTPATSTSPAAKRKTTSRHGLGPKHGSTAHKIGHEHGEPSTSAHSHGVSLPPITSEPTTPSTVAAAQNQHHPSIASKSTALPLSVYAKADISPTLSLSPTNIRPLLQHARTIVVHLEECLYVLKGLI